MDHLSPAAIRSAGRNVTCGAPAVGFERPTYPVRGGGGSAGLEEKAKSTASIGCRSVLSVAAKATRSVMP
jgi:hypothetical protein